MKRALCLAALITFCCAAVCPTFTCNPIEGNVCASYQGNSVFKLNSNGCNSGYYCSAFVTSQWAIQLSQDKAASQGNMPCDPEFTSTLTNGNWDSMSCGTKLPNKSFQSYKSLQNGQLSAACSGDSDCLLDDGTYANCVCVFSETGSGVCDAHSSNDQVYGEYWGNCTKGVIEGQDKALYWSFYKMYWAYTQTTLTCMKIFIETAMLSDLSEFNSAKMLAVGVVGLLTL